MTAPADGLSTPLRQARVAVVVNASDYDHYAVSGERQFLEACPPWTDPPAVMADHDISERLAPMLEAGAVDAVIFASNALTSAVAQQAIQKRAFIALWGPKGAAADVGVVVLHQFLAPGVELPLDFLGGAAFTLKGVQPRGVDRGRIRFQREWLFAQETPYGDRADRFLSLSQGYGAQKFCLWSSWEPRHAGQWEPLVWEEGGEVLIATGDSADRLVIASRLPLDLMGSRELLGSFIAACLRTRGCLLVQGPEASGSTVFTPALASAIERGHFVWQVSPQQASEIVPSAAPYHYFDELIVSPDWRFADLDAFDQPALLRKLEQGGSIVATFAGPADTPVTVRFSGQPQYATRANFMAAWLVPRLDAFKADLWAARGLAELVAATRDAFVDPRMIAPALRDGYVREHVGEPLAAARIHGDHVDDNVLATIGMYATVRGLGMTGYEPLRDWAEERLDVQLPSVVAQALILVPELATDERLERVRDAAAGDAAGRDDLKLLRAYAAVLLAGTEPERVAAAADASLGLGAQAQLLRAVVRNEIPATGAIVGLAALVRERIDRLASGQGGLEAVCLGNAALIELARRQGVSPSAAIRGRPRELDARTVENTELVSARDAALQAAAEARSVGRLATTILTGTLILLTVAAVGAIVIWFDKGIQEKFGFATAVFGLMSTLIAYVRAKARGAGVPPWPLR